MRNYADEILFIETVRKERRVPRTPLCPSNDSGSQLERENLATRPILRSRWVWVDGKLELRWSDDRDEPLRCAA
jgi:hypothetical protein